MIWVGISKGLEVRAGLGKGDSREYLLHFPFQNAPCNG